MAWYFSPDDQSLVDHPDDQSNENRIINSEVDQSNENRIINSEVDQTDSEYNLRDHLKHLTGEVKLHQVVSYGRCSELKTEVDALKDIISELMDEICVFKRTINQRITTLKFEVETNRKNDQFSQFSKN
jgi:hypothetical protein